MLLAVASTRPHSTLVDGQMRSPLIYSHLDIFTPSGEVLVLNTSPDVCCRICCLIAASAAALAIGACCAHHSKQFARRLSSVPVLKRDIGCSFTAAGSSFSTDSSSLIILHHCCTRVDICCEGIGAKGSWLAGPEERLSMIVLNLPMLSCSAATFAAVGC